MQFEKANIYHIYNQGNNRQRIFFNDDNYLFFLKKIKTHISPFASILAWCLMPNHFHLMVKVNYIELPVDVIAIGGATQSRTPNSTTTLNKEIGILLASYSRAIQKQENITGSLFRQRTKAECLNKIDGITPSFYNTSEGALINVHNPDEDYPIVCFNYIHQNPLKANLVTQLEDWEYSSYRDVVGVRNGTLIDKEVINELGLINIDG